MKKNRQRYSRQSSAYSLERVQAIKGAIRKWYKTVPTPKNVTSAGLVGVSYRTIALWKSDKRPTNGPSPWSMLKLWQLTKNPVFLLVPEEKEIFLRRGVDLSGFSVSPEDAPPAVSGKESLPVQQNQVAFSTKAGKLILGVITSVSVIGDLFQESGLGEVPAAIRRKAAEAILKIVSTFRLSAADFEVNISDGEVDPETRKRMDKILDLISQDGEDRNERKG